MQTRVADLLYDLNHVSGVLLQEGREIKTTDIDHILTTATEIKTLLRRDSFKVGDRYCHKESGWCVTILSIENEAVEFKQARNNRQRKLSLIEFKEQYHFSSNE